MMRLEPPLQYQAFKLEVRVDLDALIAGLKRDLKTAEKIMCHVDLAKPVCTTEYETLQVQSFVLISHSIFENFIEQAALQTVNKACKILVLEGRITKTLFALVTTRTITELTAKSKSKVKKAVISDIRHIANEAKSAYSTSVKENNGITSDNLETLLIPAGIDLEFFDAATFNLLSTYGRNRGEIAHNFNPQTTPYTKSALITECVNLTLGLENLVEELKRCVAATIPEP